MQASASHRDLPIGLPDVRIEQASVQDHGGTGGVESGGTVHLERGPGSQPLVPLQFAETGWLARDAEGLLGGPSSLLVLPMTVSRSAREDADDYLRPEPADDPDHILEHRIREPEPARLSERLGVAEIEGPGKVLPRPVQPARGQQLLRADQPQGLS